VKTASSAIFIIAMLILLTQPLVFAQPCQYTLNITNYAQVQKPCEKGTDAVITNALQIRNISESDTWGSFETCVPGNALNIGDEPSCANLECKSNT